MNKDRPLTPLGEVLEERTERPSIESIVLGEIPVVAKIGFDTGKIELRSDSKTNTNMIWVQPGDLVLSGINAEKGAIAIYGDENESPAAATIHYSSYRVNSKRADILYLWYFMRSDHFRRILADKLPGGIKTEVKAKRLLPIEIPLPPLEEQKRIVAKIESLVTRVEEAKKLNAESVAEANPMFQAIKRTAIGSPKTNPYKWPTYKLREISTTQYGMSESISGATDPELGVPIIRMANISLDGALNLDDMRYILANGVEIEKFSLQRGDLLLNWRSGSDKHVGKTAIFDNQGLYVFASFLLRIRVDRSLILPMYLKYIINFMRADGVFLDSQRLQVNNKLNASEFGEFSIMVPPLSAQRRIVAFLDRLAAKVDELKRLQTETQKELAELVPSILDKAFKGEL